jgi:hypothetical protein
LTRTLFEELDQVFGGSDKIDPALLLSSATDFNVVDYLNTDTSATSDVESPTAERGSGGHRNGRTHNPKKRSKVNTDALTEVFRKKWKEDKDSQEEREKKEDERVERAERRQEEMLTVLKGAIDALTRMADAT